MGQAKPDKGKTGDDGEFIWDFTLTLVPQNCLASTSDACRCQWYKNGLKSPPAEEDWIAWRKNGECQTCAPALRICRI